MQNTTPFLYLDGATEQYLPKDRFVRHKKTDELWFVVKGNKASTYCQRGVNVEAFKNKDLWVAMDYLLRTI